MSRDQLRFFPLDIQNVVAREFKFLWRTVNGTCSYGSSGNVEACQLRVYFANNNIHVINYSKRERERENLIPKNNKELIESAT